MRRLRLGGRPAGEERLGRVPRGPVTLVLPSTGQRRQALEHDAVGEGRRDLRVVVGRRTLDSVDPENGQLEGDAAYGVQQLPCTEAARLRGASARRVAGVAHVDVD